MDCPEHSLWKPWLDWVSKENGKQLLLHSNSSPLPNGHAHNIISVTHVFELSTLAVTCPQICCQAFKLCIILKCPEMAAPKFGRLFLRSHGDCFIHATASYVKYWNFSLAQVSLTSYSYRLIRELCFNQVLTPLTV